jgi:hypothetical protein
MKAKKAFAVIGNKLEKEYKSLGFKYFKTIQCLRKRTKKFDYYILFSPFLENLPDTFTELWVTIIIHDRSLLKKNIYANSEIIRIDLWETGGHYNIADEILINGAFIDLRNKIENYLLPQIKDLENT